MATSLFPLRYRLPKTVFEVTVTERQEVRPFPDGSRLEPVLDVTIGARARPDRLARCVTTVDESLLESVSLSVSLDEDGLIDTLGTEAGRDVAPLLDLASKVISLGVALAPVIIFAFEPETTEGELTLEQQWANAYPRSARALDKLAGQVDHYLGVLETSQVAADINAAGEALDVLHRELSAVDRMRRDWIAARAQTSEPQTWTLETLDLLRLRMDELPDTLPADQQIPLGSERLAQQGILLALIDLERRDRHEDRPSLDQTDEIVFRRARPVTMGFYRRDADSWQLDPSFTRELDIVDEHSSLDEVSLQGRWFRTRTIQLDVHPDRSVKTYAVTSGSTAAAAVTSVGGLLDSAAKISGVGAAKAQRELDAAKLRRDLLQTSSEYAQLSATHDRAAELAELEQRVKLAELTDKL